jgi:thiol-disulfide isomerase/thioredoxin
MPSRLIIAAIAFLCAFVPSWFTSSVNADEPHIVYVGAEWCGPCRGAKKFTIPELTKAGLKVVELDYDKDKLPADVTHLPTYFIMSGNKVVDTIVDHVHQSVIIDRWKKHKPLVVTPFMGSTSSAPQPKPTPPGPSPPDLVAQLRRFLGSTKPKSHSSLAWMFEEAAEIVSDATTKITRPRHINAEFDFDGDIVTIVFSGDLPQAHKLKAGTDFSVDITKITIRRNIVTATADIAFGLEHDFEIVVTKSPFDD